jgi:hypothetical protein
MIYGETMGTMEISEEFTRLIMFLQAPTLMRMYRKERPIGISTEQETSMAGETSQMLLISSQLMLHLNQQLQL